MCLRVGIFSILEYFRPLCDRLPADYVSFSITQHKCRITNCAVFWQYCLNGSPRLRFYVSATLRSFHSPFVYFTVLIGGEFLFSLPLARAPKWPVKHSRTEAITLILTDYRTIHSNVLLKKKQKTNSSKRLN